jgi:pimeloyl-ACP methyl ester carboxylesterase
VIGDSALWLSSRPELVSSPEVGVLGFSFAGGLALVAASRPELDGRLAYVTSVGGHHDLRRVLGFLMTDEIQTRNGLVREKAHDYGLVVLVYQNLDTFVEPPDRFVMRESLRQWLRENRDQSLLSASRRTTASGERLYRLLEAQDLKQLRPELDRLLDAHASELAELSPRGRLGRVRAPVYLLHGSGDSVIPPSETEWASAELGDAPHQALVSPLLEHVEVSKSAAIGHQLALVDFMSRML